VAAHHARAGGERLPGSGFVLVAVAALRLRKEIGASPAIVVAAIAGSTIVLVGFVVDLFNNDRQAFWVLIALVLLVAVNELCKRRSDTQAIAD
jgi:cyanate permease